jgi:hypothetical protein
MRHLALTLVLSTGCAFVHAQTPAPTPVGSVAEVHGLVTMSFGSNVATVQPDTPVFDGARFVASSSGGAELKLKEGGCVIKLQPNQWVSIDSSLSCDQQTAAVRMLTPDNVAGSSSYMREIVPLLTSTALVGAIRRLPDGKITPTPR